MGQEKAGCINKDVVRAVGAFGGGIAGSGDTCGILIGAVALISSLYSRGDLDGKEDPRMWIMSKKFIKEFNQLIRPYRSNKCCDIAMVDWQDKVAAKEYYSDPASRRQICIELVADSSAILGRILEQAKESST